MRRDGAMSGEGWGSVSVLGSIICLSKAMVNSPDFVSCLCVPAYTYISPVALSDWCCSECIGMYCM